MLEKLYCAQCHASLTSTNLARWSPVVIKCPYCDYVNTFTFDTSRYVQKRPDAEPEPLPLEAR